MKLRNFIIVFLLSFGLYAYAQQSEEMTEDDDELLVYRAENTKINNLEHTKLKVSFDFEKKHVLGEAWLTLQPHFYPTSTLTLDAKAMLIDQVTLNDQKLDFNYDGKKIAINLGKQYTRNEAYTVYIKYTARPEEVKQTGSNVILSAKGLYFIDPLDTDPNKPTQIWTQGETESSSCWFPTIDSPNQKT